MPKLIEESIETNEDTAELMVLERDDTADPRVLISVLIVALSTESTAANETAEALSAEDSDAPADMRALSSVLRPALSPESTSVNEAAEALSAEDSDAPADMRALSSVVSPVLRATSFAMREDVTALRAVESDVTSAFCRLISEFTLFNKSVVPFITVDANDGSFPIAVARSDSVFSVAFNPSPAMFATLTLT
jgi:hypothetical protein